MSLAPHHETLNAPDGSALTWIFDHCLRYADNYEISLRAAYELNCHPSKSTMAPSFIPRSPSIFSRSSVWSKNSRNSKSSFDAPSYDTNAEFRAYLSKTVAELSSQPCSLPPVFIINFVRRCFCLDLSDVDFAQALTALDYLRDLQARWKKEIDAAFNRLNITSQDASDPQHSEVARKFPNVMVWYNDISKKARMIDFLYTQVYVGLRRWVLVNQMMLEPFDKANCLALLNTLLPPLHRDSSTPTQQLSTAILGNHRDTFFKFITTFESDPSILDPIMKQGARPGDENGWPALYDVVDRYLNAALEMIDECVLINEPGQINKSGVQRRTDSGISFGPDFGPCPSSFQPSDTEKPLPHFPEPSTAAGTSKHGSLLERFASLSTWGKKKDPEREQQREQQREQRERQREQREQQREFERSLKKMRSLKELNSQSSSTKSTKSGKSTKTSAKFNATISFDLTDDKRRRLIDEAQTRKAVDAAEADKSIGQAI